MGRRGGPTPPEAVRAAQNGTFISSQTLSEVKAGVPFFVSLFALEASSVIAWNSRNCGIYEKTRAVFEGKVP